jgi:replicative DNA helicase
VTGNLVTFPGRVPPHDLDAETAVLSAITLEGAPVLDRVRGTLAPQGTFYSPANRWIFDACCALADSGTPIDSVTVANWLKSRERLTEIGGVPYLMKVVDAVPAVAHVETYAELIAEKWRVRNMIAACQRVAAEGYGDIGKAQEWLDGAEQSVFEITQRAGTSTGQFIKEPIKTFFGRLEDAARRGVKTLGLPTGFQGIDDLMTGLHPGDVTIIAARPGMGKTALALCIAANVASMQTDGPRNIAAVFSLEMPKDQLAARAVCCEARVDVGKVRSATLNAQDWKALTEASAWLATCPLWIDDPVQLSIPDLRSRCRRVAAAAKAPSENDPGEKLALVVVDYLQLMVAVGNHGTRDQEIGEISRGLKALAKELGVPVIALSQLNRSVETRSTKDKRPQLSDLRESGNIEQDADNIVFVYRDEYYNKDSPARGIAELIIAKQRNGPTGKVAVRFFNAYTRFDNLAPGEIPEGVDFE